MTEHIRWIGEQLAILSAVFNEPMTAEKYRLWAESLADISREPLQIAFTRALRELRWFPKPVELRELAGVKAAERTKQSAEADAAWNWANAHLERWGVDQIPIFRARHEDGVENPENWSHPPTIPDRIEFALRRIGGLAGLNQVTEQNRAFVYKDFCEAFNLYAVEQPQPEAKYALAGEVKQLMGAVAQTVAQNQTLPALKEASVDPSELRQQLHSLVKKMPETSHTQKLRQFEERPTQSPPAVVMTPEQIMARREQERTEIERYREKVDREKSA